MNGYFGKLLRVNLTTGEVRVDPVDPKTSMDFIGGRGLGTKLFYDEVGPLVEPLSIDNKLFFMTGPLTGAAVPTGGRYMVITKAPLTGTIGSSNSGGKWGAELKHAGYDGLVVEGKADHPVYINIEDDKVEIRDASHLWGKLLSDTTAVLSGEIPPRAKVLSIGPAGEKLSYMASIMNDIHRAAGRSGVGAVMGSKNLKAITVKGSQQAPIADEAKLKEANDEALTLIRENGVTSVGLPNYGSAVLVNIINENGILPTNNFQESSFKDADMISGEHMTEKYLLRKDPCYRCPIGCGRYVKLGDWEGGGPEYETIWSFGSDCGINDFEKIILANKMANEYGLDTISAGATIAAAMELYQLGLIKDEELDGASLKWGDSDAIIEWTKRMGERSGLGDKMSDGSYRLCESYGVPELSMSSKKQEMPAYDPRGVQGQGLSYATSNRGGCHVRGYMISPEILGSPEKLDRFTTNGKATWTKIFQDLTATIDSLGLCLFTSFALGAPQYARMLSAATGEEVTVEGLLQKGERIWNLERMFNLEAGITPDQDTLPKRLLEDPVTDGPSKGEVTKLDIMLPEYYMVRGWDKGIPTQEKLTELGLN
ncbi:MAG: aldehyde ferredoxin oxidoreductase family protein [Clostridiaceae bacterium]